MYLVAGANVDGIYNMIKTNVPKRRFIMAAGVCSATDVAGASYSHSTAFCA